MGATCGFCQLDMDTATTCTITPIKGLDPIPWQGFERCPGCGVTRGGYHHPGCGTERCPACGDLATGCACDVPWVL